MAFLSWMGGPDDGKRQCRKLIMVMARHYDSLSGLRPPFHEASFPIGGGASAPSVLDCNLSVKRN